MIKFFLIYIKRHGQHLLKFFLTGGVASGINIVLLFILTDLFSVWYLVSSIISYISAISFSFVVQKFWTFNHQQSVGLRLQVIGHIVLSLFGLILNTTLLYLLVEYVNLWYISAQVISAVFIAVCNFIVYKYFIFSPQINVTD